MRNRIFKKLSSQMGESIGETLVALLISALALVMLAGAVSSGMRIVTNSKEKMESNDSSIAEIQKMLSSYQKKAIDHEAIKKAQ